MKIKNTTLKIVRGHGPRLSLAKAGVNERTIRRAYANALHRAAKLKSHAIVLPTIDCGEEKFPLVGITKIMAQEILRFARYEKNSVKNIIIKVADPRASSIYKTRIEGYMRHVQEDLGLGPYVTVDMIIELKTGIVAIERSNPPYGWALPGGFVDPFESLETAVRREAKEETNLRLTNLRQLGTYSDPKRDPRFHTIATVYVAKGIGQPKAGDDAQGLKVVKYSDLRKFKFAFDHGKMIRDYLQAKDL